MKVLVTGAKGQLGFDCVRELKNKSFDVLGIDIDDLDITCEKEVYDFINVSRPDVIIHCAGWTAVDKAESAREEVHKINVLGTKYITGASIEIGAKLVYVSTDYVFSGNGNKFHQIDDEKNPQNYYGKTKLDGEIEASKNPKSFIVRISWAFGFNGNNFVKTMINLSKTKTEIDVVCDQIGSPTYTHDLAKLLCDMIVTEKYGIYHATNEGICSWADFAKEIFRQIGSSTVVHSLRTNEYLKGKTGITKRPLNSRLSKRSLDQAGFNRLPTWQDALARYLEEIKAI